MTRKHIAGVSKMVEKPSRKPQKYTREDLAMIGRVYPVSGAAGCQVLMPNRSLKSIYQKAADMGVNVSPEAASRRPLRQFEIGASVNGVTIMGVEVDGTTAASVVYCVRHGCCGSIDRMTHDRVVRRGKGTRQQCRNCTRGVAQKAAQAERTGKPLGSPDARFSQGGFLRIDEIPAEKRPKPRINDADIERHLRAVFRYTARSGR